ncbi:hypothetical protein T484DRAFT_1918979 [Baffinella frigidus]|nr:hypothetical protein T484DRAFT_1918979 [Cryptophyta sp. CCMP2293]
MVLNAIEQEMQGVNQEGQAEYVEEEEEGGSEGEDAGEEGEREGEGKKDGEAGAEEQEGEGEKGEMEDEGKKEVADEMEDGGKDESSAGQGIASLLRIAKAENKNLTDLVAFNASNAAMAATLDKDRVLKVRKLQEDAEEERKQKNLAKSAAGAVVSSLGGMGGKSLQVAVSGGGGGAWGKFQVETRVVVPGGTTIVVYFDGELGSHVVPILNDAMFASGYRVSFGVGPQSDVFEAALGMEGAKTPGLLRPAFFSGDLVEVIGAVGTFVAVLGENDTHTVWLHIGEGSFRLGPDIPTQVKNYMMSGPAGEIWNSIQVGMRSQVEGGAGEGAGGVGVGEGGLDAVGVGAGEGLLTSTEETGGGSVVGGIFGEEDGMGEAGEGGMVLDGAYVTW